MLLHSFDLWDLPTGEFFSMLIFQPGLFAHGPLEKLEFVGLPDGLFAVIIIQNHMLLNHLRVLDQTKLILVA